MIAVGLLLSLFCNSCQEDLLSSETARVEEGLPATLTLNVKVNDMGEFSRSTIVDEEGANYCDNIWIGLYSKDTGKRVNYYYITDVANTQEQVGEYYKLQIYTESVNDVYIVAVANSDVNSGVSDISQYGSESSTLRKMLDEATTYDKFKNICVLRPDAKDVNIYANTLTMSGWYAAPGKSYDDPSAIEAVSIKEGENDLDGAIYLRRIISYNKFVIVPGDYVNLTLNTWKVCNIPAGSYLYEQTDNIADHYTGSEQFFNESLASRLFTATTNSEGKAGQYFEFYQLENKHMATDYALDGTDHVGINPDAADFYTEREREFKTTSGTEGTSDYKETNSSVYRSLVNASKTNLDNNYASYVVINADIDYYVAAPESGQTTDFDPTTAEPIDPTSGVKMIHRTANVNYTIHLGYCEDKDANDNATLETARDFNCRRNSRYTYNVKINGVKNVVVEAKKQGENQPGAEGWVSDDTGDFVKLDSHYCEFNIALTDEERENLTYRITAPYGNEYYYYSRDKEGNITKTDGMNSQLYEWIKFRPTTGENVLASYNGGKDLWTFDDLCAPTLTTNTNEADAQGRKWYTVFVDEYVYTFDDPSSGEETSWPNYVNKDDRMAEFIMNVDKSNDTESSYSYCKYAFSQKAIQTYYKGVEAGKKAIGIEHFEETYCFNMYWQFFNSSDNWTHLEERKYKEDDDNLFYDYTNGRYNLYHYLDKAGITDWSKVIQETVPAHVIGDTNGGCTHPDADYPVYMPGNKASTKTSYAPSKNKDSNVYYGNSICMNRNRDLDGDGVIDNNEIRWYTPTSSDYIQIGICQGELPDPIMRFTDYNPDYFISTWNSANNYYTGVANFHYITSDYQYYWAEQCVNVGDAPFATYTQQAAQANTVRCVRNLGTNPNDVPQYGVNEVDNAFSYDEDARIFTQENFKDETLRGYTLGGLAPHDVSSPTSHPYKKFQVATSYCTAKDSYISFAGGTLGYVAAIDNTSTSDDAGTNTQKQSKTAAWTNSLRINGVCSQYYEATDKSDLGTWRIPSACELALMWIEGLPMKDDTNFLCASYDYFISYYLRKLSDNNHLYLGYNNDNDRKVPALDVLGKTIKLRCVRDVK
jgi:hypothetical protein